MRTHPIGTGPFKFVEFKPNESSTWPQSRLLEEGPALSRRHRIYDHSEPLDAVLAFIAGKFDMTFPFEVTIPLLKDIKTQAPDAICDLAPGNASTNLIVNRDKPPFDNPDIRRAMSLTPRPQSLYRHSRRGAGRYRRRNAAAAGGIGACRRSC